MIRQKIFMAIASLVLCACSSFHLNAQTVTGTLRDSLTGDQNSNGIANPGDSIAYKAKLKNTSGSGATGVQYNNPTPANTQLGTNTRTSALARNDVGAVVFNGTLTGGNVLSNDFGIPAPSVLTYGPTANPGATGAGNTGTTNGGGSVVITSGGALTYTPLAGYTGNDQFGYIAGNGNLPNNSATMLISVGNPATASNDSYNAVGNVSITLNAALGVKANDGGDATVVETVQGSAANVGVSTNTANNGQVILQANGSFTYNPPPGFEGTDNFTYTVDNGFNTPASATVSITVAGMIWFVNNSGANGDGRLSSPFNSLAGVSNGAGGSAAGDNIFIYSGSGSYSGGIVLLSNQKLIGQGTLASLATLAGVSPPSYSATLPATFGVAPIIVNAAGNGVTLNSATTANTVRGILIQNCTGSALSGSNFGTVTVDPDFSINTTGQAISLSTGTISGNFGSVTSTGGTNNVSFGGCTGTTSFGGSMSGASGTSFNVSGSSVNITYTGNITQSNNALMVSVNGHGGNITFNTGTLNASNGNGLSFSSVSGTYSFNGTTTLNGGAAHIAISTGGGTFNFGSNTSITNPAAAAFSISGGGPNVTYSGSITMSSNNTMVSVLNQASGTVTFQTGTLSATNGSGLQFDNAGGTYNFNGTTTLNGGGAQTNIVNSNGSFSFNGSTTITSPSDTAFAIVGGSASVTYNGNITQANNFSMVSISGGHLSGTVTFQTGTLNATNGNGLQFDNADGVYNFNGTNTMNGGGAGIDIVNGSTGSFTFGSSTNITRANGVSGEAFNLTSSNATVIYNGNMTLGTSTGNLVNISTHTAGNITFNSGTLSKGSSTTQGISISGVTGGTVAFNNPTITITMTSGNAISLTGNTGGTINFAPSGGSGVDLVTTSGIGFNATGGGTISLTGSGNTISSTTGSALNVTSTTIGGSGLTFQSISSNGAANGINLNTTGAGGLTVSGDGGGSSNGSGGTINASTGKGVSLTSVANISLNYMNISSGGNDGIDGTTVNGFTLTRSNITNNGNADEEHGIEFANLTGTASVSNTTVSGSFEHNFKITNTSGTLSSLTISSCTFSHTTIPVSPAGGNGFLLTTQNSAIVTAGNITGCTFRNNFSNGVLVNSENSSIISSFYCQGGTFDDNNIAIQFGAFHGSQNTCKILNNTIINDQRRATSGPNSTSHAMVFGSSAIATAGSIFQARITGNIIGSTSFAGSGSSIGSGIRTIVQGLTTGTILLDNNTIRECPSGFGMELNHLGPTTTGQTVPTTDITVTNNNVNHVNLGFNPGTSDFPLPAIYLNGDNQGTAPPVRADVRTNTVPSGSAFNFLGTYIEVYEYTGSSPGNLSLRNTSGAANATQQLTNTNTGSAAANVPNVTLIAVGPLNQPPL